jgi:poly-gamma-glutamate capsule biosynthesis protein CapA/YwtB (metallophosphatase superfamily)
MEAIKIVAFGDVQPNLDKPETLFDTVAEELAWGDVRFCQLECTLSDRGTIRSDVQNPAHRIDPHMVSALTSHNIDLITYAGNNNLDYGDEAFLDTLDVLSANGIKYVGAGRNLDEARQPVYQTVNGITIAWVDFCSILREGFAARPKRPGISPLHIRTYYEPLENIYEQPGTPARTVTVPDADDFEAAMASIRTARENADIVIACFHWGVHFTHDLSAYQADIGHAAIDNGADLVLGTHPHCLQAVDVYKGKYIFYSLGNFAFLQPESFAQSGVAKYLTFYGVPSDPELSEHPHPAYCRKTILLKIEATKAGISGVECVPVYLNSAARPEVQQPGTPMYDEIIGLMSTLCAEVGTELKTDGGSFTILPEKSQPIDTRRLLRYRSDSYSWLRRLALGQPIA